MNKHKQFIEETGQSLRFASWKSNKVNTQRKKSPSSTRVSQVVGVKISPCDNSSEQTSKSYLERAEELEEIWEIVINKKQIYLCQKMVKELKKEIEERQKEINKIQLIQDSEEYEENQKAIKKLNKIIGDKE